MNQNLMTSHQATIAKKGKARAQIHQNTTISQIDQYLIKIFWIHAMLFTKIPIAVGQKPHGLVLTFRLTKAYVSTNSKTTLNYGLIQQ